MKEKQVVRLNWTLCVCIIVYIALHFAYSFASAIFNWPELDIIPVLIVSQLMVWGSLLVATLICRPKIFDAELFKVKTSPGKFIANTILTVFFFVCVMPTCWTMNLISQLFAKNYVNDTTADLTSMELWVQLLAIAVMPAVSEELLCRGAAMGGLRRYNPLKAAIITGLFFGTLHLNINQFSYTVVLGIFIAVLNECTGYIYSSMLVHFLMNSLSVVLIHFLTKITGQGIFNNLIAEVSTQAATENESLSKGSMVLAIMIVGVIAVIGATIAILILYLIAYINHGEKPFKKVFYKTETKMFTGGFYAMLIVGFAYMIIFEFILV